MPLLSPSVVSCSQLLLSRFLPYIYYIWYSQWLFLENKTIYLCAVLMLFSRLTVGTFLCLPNESCTTRWKHCGHHPIFRFGCYWHISFGVSWHIKPALTVKAIVNKKPFPFGTLEGPNIVERKVNGHFILSRKGFYLKHFEYLCIVIIGNGLWRH